MNVGGYEFLRYSECKNPLGVRAVYALVINGTIEYIGATKNLGNRISDHKRITLKGVSFEAFYMPSDDQFTIESELIEVVRPKLNISGNPDRLKEASKDKRKEVSLNEDVIKKLEGKAKKENRNLKNYMEQVLIKDSKK